MHIDINIARKRHSKNLTKAICREKYARDEYDWEKAESMSKEKKLEENKIIKVKLKGRSNHKVSGSMLN